MKLTTHLMAAVLILFGLFAAVYALSGFDLLAVLVFGNEYVYRALLSLCGIAAAWLLFWLIAFRPTKYVS